MPANTSAYVTLISSDDYEFIISREAACVAGTIKKMLDPQSQSFPGTARRPQKLTAAAL